MDDLLARAVQDEFEDAVQMRRHIHQHPELSFQETQTTAYIDGKLRTFGFSPKPLSGTGLICDIGEAGGHSILLRADIDALPMQEETGLPFSSENPGVMHSCGHDLHTANLLGVAKILSKHPEWIRGRIRLLFQPAEELFPGGARAAIKDGVTDGMDAVYGMHVKPYLAWNEVSAREGRITAATGGFKIRIKGVGGHGASPHLLKDPVLAACSLVTALQSIVSRNLNPVESGVISTCMIHGGTKGNIMPETVELEGTIRGSSKEVRSFLEKRICEMADDTAHAFACSAVTSLSTDGYDPVCNDAECTKKALSAFGKLSSSSVRILPPEMGGEDFAYYEEVIPGCFFHVGYSTDAEHPAAPQHSPHMIADERLLLTSMEAFLRVLVEENVLEV